MKPPIVSGKRVAEYKLATAMLVYKDTHGDHYATLHPVTHDAGRATIGAGQPLTESALRSTLQDLGAPKGMGGWVPPCLLYIDDNTLVWHVYPRHRTVFFTSGAGVGVKSLNAPHPGLVFAVNRNGWHVAATRNAHELAAPLPSVPLYHAPYPNVYDNGSICTGNVTLPERIAPDTLAGFDAAFFDSKFTHSNNPDATTHPKGLTGLWQFLVDAKPAHFPLDYLSPMNLTLDQWVGRIVKGRT
jgi:PRTRC genetic system protein B